MPGHRGGHGRTSTMRGPTMSVSAIASRAHAASVNPAPSSAVISQITTTNANGTITITYANGSTAVLTQPNPKPSLVNREVTASERRWFDHDQDLLRQRHDRDEDRACDRDGDATERPPAGSPGCARSEQQGGPAAHAAQDLVGILWRTAPLGASTIGPAADPAPRPRPRSSRSAAAPRYRRRSAGDRARHQPGRAGKRPAGHAGSSARPSARTSRGARSGRNRP
jgi:hypothetical protein